MRFIYIALLSAIALSYGAEADAAEAGGVVHAMHAPAWVERNNRLQPLRPGQRLRAGDVVHTGRGARLEVDMDEGSVVKLGSEAELAMPSMAMREDAGSGVFTGVLNLLKGAFRFTTRLAGESRRRDVQVRIGAVTAGIRGTDIWGRSDASGDLLVLLEGEIEVSMAGHDTMMMSEPLHAVLMAPTGVMQELTLDVPTVQQAALETEMRAEGAMMMMAGDTRLVLMSVLDRRHAERLVETLATAGYAADTEIVDVNGRSYTRVLIGMLADSEHARRLGRELDGRFGISGTWVSD